MAVTHTTVAVAADDPAVEINKAEWNDSHVVADGSFVATKLSATATDKVFGRSTAGAGNGEEIPLTAFGRSLIDDAAASNARTTLGLVIGTDVPGQAAFDDHSARHEAGGADALAIDAAVATGSLRTLGTGATQAAVGNHAHAGSGAFIGARVGEATAQTIANSTFTALTFNDTDLLDTDAYHDPATNNTRLTIPAGRPGVYIVTGNCSYVAGSSAGQRFLGIRLNGNANLWLGRQGLNPATGGRHMSVVGGPVALVATDYVELIAFHNDGANLDVGGANNEHFFSLEFRGT